MRIAIDDFGTGYATLSQLLSLKLDRIKIDRSFIDRLGKDVESTTIVRAVIGLAHGFELETTAEGVENDEQVAFLKADGCLGGQGYLFSKAVPANQVPWLLERRKSSRRGEQRQGVVAHGLIVTYHVVLPFGRDVDGNLVPLEPAEAPQRRNSQAACPASG